MGIKESDSYAPVLVRPSTPEACQAAEEAGGSHCPEALRELNKVVD